MTEIPTDRHITYQERYNTCGKEDCPCHSDKSRRHGPYMYAIWTENSKLKSGYIGKAHPDENTPDKRAKLTREDVLDIRARLANGERPRDIAQLKGVGSGAISNIRRGTAWKGVQA